MAYILVRKKQKKSLAMRVVLSAFMFIIFVSAVSAGEHVVARVGNAVITQEDLEKAIDNYIPRGGFHRSVSKEKRDEYRNSALEWLVEKELLYQEARRRGLKIGTQELDAVTKFNEVRFGSRAAFLDALKQEGKTLQEFRAAVEREALIASVARKEIDEKSVYSDEELKEYYNKNKEKFIKPDAIRIWHILISVSPESTDEMRKEKKAHAHELLEKIKAGEDFSSVADRYSEDAYRVKGGDMGYIHRGRLTAEVENAAYTLKEGAVSNVIESIYGFHIIKAGDAKASETVSFEDIKTKLRAELESGRYETTRRHYIDLLKERTSIVLY